MGDFLGIDVDAAPGLASTLRTWETGVDSALALVAQAETLSDLATNVHQPLYEVADTGRTLSVAINSAVAEALAFHIDIDTVLGPMPSAYGYGLGLPGYQDSLPATPLDPARLSALGEQGMTPEAAAAWIAANGSPTDHRFGTVGHAGTLTTLELHQIVTNWEASGRSGNDPIFDTFLRELNVRSNEVGGADAVLLDIDTLVVAELTGLEYNTVYGALLLESIDDLAVDLHSAPGPEQHAIYLELRETIAEFAQGDEELTSQLATAISNGATMGEALNLLDTVSLLSLEPSLHDLAAMVDTANGLVSDDFTIANANAVAAVSAATGFDPEIIKATMADNGLDVFGAVTLLASNSVAMSVEEFQAYNGLIEHFDVIDNAGGGDADNVISRANLEFVVSAPPGTFDDAVVAAAQGILDNQALYNRLDDAGANETLLDDITFGSATTGDGKVSKTDLNAFALKQFINTNLFEHAGAIDIAAQGGTPDDYRSYSDFQAFLEQNEDLTDEEVNAVNLLLEAGLHDQTWWEEHKREIALGLAVVAGVAFVVFTGGTGLIVLAGGAAAGATVAGGSTLIINAASDEFDWDDQLYSNTALGAVAGAGSAALAEYGIAAYGAGSLSGGLSTVAGGSTVAQVATASGLVADASGLIGLGAFDAALDPALSLVGQQDALDEIHDVANTVSLVTGLPAGAYAITQIPRAIDIGLDRLANRWVDSIIPPNLNAVNTPGLDDIGEFVADGVPHTDAVAFLEGTTEGQQIIDTLLGASDVDHDTAVRWAADYVESGTALPSLVELPAGTPLVKIVPAGRPPETYSPYWTTPDALQTAIDEAMRGNTTLIDTFGLPSASHATDYEVYVINAIDDVEVVVSTIAPTAEAPFATTGGSPQFITPDRSLFESAELLGPVQFPATIPNATVAAPAVVVGGHVE